MLSFLFDDFVNWESFEFFSTGLTSIYEFFIIINFYFCKAKETLSNELYISGNLKVDDGASDNSVHRIRDAFLFSRRSINSIIWFNINYYQSLTNLNTRFQYTRPFRNAVFKTFVLSNSNAPSSLTTYPLKFDKITSIHGVGRMLSPDYLCNRFFRCIDLQGLIKNFFPERVYESVYCHNAPTTTTKFQFPVV